MTTNDIALTQHFTTRSAEIIGNLWDDLPHNIHAVEPFYGSGDLIKNQPEGKIASWEFYDIDPTHCNPSSLPNFSVRDTLLNPPDYREKYVITNPPYLARNKAKDKKVFDLYGTDDLYKASLLSVLDSAGGIQVVPMNFFTDKRSGRVRERFLKEFSIITLNVFNYPVFDTTNYQICTFSYTKRSFNQNTRLVVWEDKQTLLEQEITLTPQKSSLHQEEYDQLFGIPMRRKYQRLVENMPVRGTIIPLVFYVTDTHARAYHASTQGDYRNSIRCVPGDPFYGIHTSRNCASFSVDSDIDHIEDWDAVAKEWNSRIARFREDTGNTTLTSFRDVGRKRLSFLEAQHVLDLVLDNHDG